MDSPRLEDVLDEDTMMALEEITVFSPGFKLPRTPPRGGGGGGGGGANRNNLTPGTTPRQQTRSISSAAVVTPSKKATNLRIDPRQDSLTRSASNGSVAAISATARTMGNESPPSLPFTKCSVPGAVSKVASMSRLPVSSPKPKSTRTLNTPTGATRACRTAKFKSPMQPGRVNDENAPLIGKAPQRTPVRSSSTQTGGGMFSASVGPARVTSAVRVKERVAEIESPGKQHGKQTTDSRKLPPAAATVSSPARPTRIRITPQDLVMQAAEEMDCGNGDNDENNTTPTGPVPKLMILKRTTTCIDAGTSSIKALASLSPSKTNSALSNLQNLVNLSPTSIKKNAPQRSPGKGSPSAKEVVDRVPFAASSQQKKTPAGVHQTSHLPVPTTPSPLRTLHRHPTPRIAVPLSRRKLPTAKLTPSQPPPLFMELFNASLERKKDEAKAAETVKATAAGQSATLPPGLQKHRPFTPASKIHSGSPTGNRRRHPRRSGAADLVHKVWTGRTQPADPGIAFLAGDKTKIKEVIENLHSQIAAKRESLTRSKESAADLEQQLRKLNESTEKEEGELLALMNAVALCEHCL